MMPSTQGVKLRFFNPDVDVLLLELPSAIPASFQTYQLGWDARPLAPPAAAVGIHYPHGAPRAISYTQCALLVPCLGLCRFSGGLAFTTRTAPRARPHSRCAPYGCPI